ncbi:MAG TPA: hypothetical protein DIS96_05280 [Pusillimonas sp.]|nr:hypothetical protein [Pusillimonas sp.]
MTGIAHVSEGQSLSWFGSGKTELITASDLEVIYGVRTEVTVGVKNDIALALQSETFVGSKFEAKLSAEFELTKTATVESAKEGEFYYMDSYIGTVGASAEQVAYAKTLRTATFTLLTVQTLAMLAAVAYATQQKITSPSEDEELEVPGLDIALGQLTSIASIAATLAPLLLLKYGKWRKLGENDSPAGVLTMDAIGGVFLGTRKMTAPSPTSGVFISENSVQLSSSNTDLGYDKPNGGTSILGFSRSAGSAGVGGSRLEVSNDGMTRIYGSGIRADLLTDGGVSSHTVNAQAHSLNVTTSNSTMAAGPALNLTDTGVQAKYNDENSFSVGDRTISALAGGPTGSVMRLTSSESSMGTAGNNITINDTGVVLSFGESKVRIDATGFSLGDAVTVLNPGPPGLTFSGITDAVTDVATLTTEMTARKLTETALEDKYQVLKEATDTLNSVLMTTRNRVDEITEQLNAE